LGQLRNKATQFLRRGRLYQGADRVAKFPKNNRSRGWLAVRDNFRNWMVANAA